MSVWNYFKYGRRLFYKRNASPLYLVFFVTERCNARCRHCLLGGIHPGRDELTLEEIERVSRSMDDFLFLLPTGGEPFLRSDLPEIVEVFYRNNHIQNVGIPTNGGLTEKVVGAVEEILRRCPGLDLMVDVSIDGIGPDHDEIRRVPGLFEKAMETFRRLKEIDAAHPRFTASIETTVSSFNDDKLEDMFRYFTEKAGAQSIFTLLCRGKPMEPAAKFFDIERYTRYAEALEAGMMRRRLTGYDKFPFADLINAKRIVRHRLIGRIIRENRMVLPCYAGILGAALFANGDVLPCELHSDLTMGNVREAGYDFKRIWFGAAAVRARETIRKQKCFCTYECFLTLNILFNPRMYPQLIKEYLKVKWAKLFGRRQ
ncbi:MAG TPA: radical SAM protein [bacterium]|nr:radical SAM protein [bacterium]HPQ66742.1 radical SAM protein [bacterium]